jgi:hypothetical protein
VPGSPAPIDAFTNNYFITKTIICKGLFSDLSEHKGMVLLCCRVIAAPKDNQTNKGRTGSAPENTAPSTVTPRATLRRQFTR